MPSPPSTPSSMLPSTASRSSTSPPPSSTIPIHIKTPTDSTLTLTVPATLEISSLTLLLSLRLSLPPSDLRLAFAGKHLSDPAQTLEACGVGREAVVHLALPLRGGMPMVGDSSSASASTTAPSATTSSSTSTLPTKSSASGGSRRPRGARCNHPACSQLAQRIVGECGFCNGRFCGRHRLLEDHDCTGLEECRREGRERNRDTLEGERTMAVKGI